MVVYQILSDGAEPRDAGMSWLSSPVRQDPLGKTICCRITIYGDVTAAVSLCVFVVYFPIHNNMKSLLTLHATKLVLSACVRHTVVEHCLETV